mmetsp:Transcript_36856/g.105905  ORF Transcript_36856/g.105905 Transcript_36856/m.105905 type:complete len:297 (-) Transcript_36856:217-1107(-)
MPELRVVADRPSLLQHTAPHRRARGPREGGGAPVDRWQVSLPSEGKPSISGSPPPSSEGLVLFAFGSASECGRPLDRKAAARSAKDWASCARQGAGARNPAEAASHRGKGVRVPAGWHAQACAIRALAKGEAAVCRRAGVPNIVGLGILGQGPGTAVGVPHASGHRQPQLGRIGLRRWYMALLRGVDGRPHNLHVGHQALERMHVALYGGVRVEEAGVLVVLLDHLSLHGPEAAATTPMCPLLTEVQVGMPQGLADGDGHIDVVGCKIVPLRRQFREVREAPQEALWHGAALQLLK